MTQPDYPSGEEGLAPEEAAVRPAVFALPVTILLLLTVLIAGDVVADLRAGTSPGHIAIEVTAMLVALGGAVALWRRLLGAGRRARALESTLSVARSELSRARADLAGFRSESEAAMRGLGAAIDRQFERWDLSSAEREVALLLLKGLASKEVAGVRGTSERTVRQQALSVYRKAGLAGRAELAAFFLEDLLLPPPVEGCDGEKTAGAVSGRR
jgi:DNA-binding CsgD family transcriptional regulator